MDNGIFVDTKDYAVFAAKVKNADKAIYKAMRKAINDETKKVVREVRQAALNLPSSGAAEADTYSAKKMGAFGVGLRTALAASVESKIISRASKNLFGVRIRVSGTRFRELSGTYKGNKPRRPRKLPRYVEGLGRKFQRWRHPVYGDRETWVQQSAKPFLMPTANKHRLAVREAVRQAFKEAARQVGFTK